MSGTSTQIGAYAAEMNRGRAALTVSDFPAAYHHFGQAHDIGHGVLAQHLAAHRALLTTAWKQRRIDRAAKQFALFTLAAVVNRDTRDPGQALANRGW